MKNILLISHGDYEYDGRLRELLKVANNIGNVFCITKGSKESSKNHRIYTGGNYLQFIIKAVNYGKKISSKIDILFLDNRKSIIPGIILSRILKPKIIILDCRELYIAKELKHLTGKIGCFVEKKGIEKANIIIAANSFRAEIMQEIYHLKEKPLVYENLRKLEYSSNEAHNKAAIKLNKYIKTDEIKIVSTSGCDTNRLNDILVKNIDKVNTQCRLFLVGDSDKASRRKIEEIINDKKLKNVEILGRLNQDELKFLIDNCHIGIVNYNQNDTNNKYCASGKLYEFIFEGIPVVTTTNPTLKPLCDINSVGCSDDMFYKGINKVISNYSFYRKKVNIFKNTESIEKNNDNLLKQLLERISLRF